MHRFTPLLYFICWLLHVSTVVCHLQGASESVRGIAILFYYTSALEGCKGSASRPDRFLPPGKTWYPLYRRLGGPQGWSGRVRKKSRLPPGFDPQTVQPVASRYTD
jgi:hypothetical protein